jgi:transposase-like protein
MNRRITFHGVCAMLAARHLYNAGVAVSEIARQAGRSRSTIVRWIKTTGVVRMHGRKPDRKRSP